MGPIEHTICQIAFTIEEKYKDKAFADQVLHFASLVHNVEIAPKDWQTNQDIKKIHKIGHEIKKDREQNK